MGVFVKTCSSETLNTTIEHKERGEVLYSRVSSAGQKQDLQRQVQRLKAYAANQDIENVIEISDVGAGIYFKKTGFLQLLKLLFQGKISFIIVVHKDP